MLLSKLKEHRFYLFIIIFVTVFLALMPILKIIPATGFNLPRITRAAANFVYGSTYYSARIREIKDGHYFIGNPYFIEHNNEPAPAFFVADWIAAAPYLAGLSFDVTMVFNALLWSIIFTLLAYTILLNLGISKKGALLGALLTYTQGVFLILPAVSMQTIFPFFMVLLLAYVFWSKKPEDKKRIVFLTLAISGGVYVYTYLMQVVAVFIFFATIYFLLQKNFRTAGYLAGSSILALVISSPIIFYTINQLKHQFYWETMGRIGLVSTHLPTFQALASGGWTMMIVVLYYLSRRKIQELKENKNFSSATIFFIISGLAMSFVIVSNVVTGKELELSGHIERFMAIWTPLAIATYFYFTYDLVKLNNVFKTKKRIAIIILFFVSCFSLWHYSRVYWSYFQQQGDNIEYIKETFNYNAPINWLNENVSQPSVIMVNVNDPILNFISEYTKHYVLFGNGGILHIVSNNEIEERYLVSRYFDNTDKHGIKQDFQIYGGVGNAVHQYKTYNRQVKLCKLLKLNLLGINCGTEASDAVSFRGSKYFDDLFERYNVYKITINEELKKFHVTYIVENKKIGAQRNFGYDMRNIENVTKVYDDTYFSIFKLGR